LGICIDFRVDGDFSYIIGSEVTNIRDGHPKYPTCGHLKIPHPSVPISK
jgi:predicted transcriptional regulator YdeE